MSGQAEKTAADDVRQPVSAFIPASGTTAVPQEFAPLADWFSSDAFQQRLTQGFWDAKRLAIAERDRLQKDEQ